MEFLFPAGKWDRPFPAACQINYKGCLMRLSCLLLAIGCTGLQLLMANTGKGQGLNETRITLELKNGSLKTAFARIEKQTDFRFAYSKRQVENYKSINLARAEYTIQQALEALLANTRLSFKQVSNKIIIVEKDHVEEHEKSEARLALAPIPQTDGSIKGKITNEKGEPLFGASIQLTGVTKGTAADNEGNFMITGIKAGTYKLRISAVGFENTVREVTIREGETTELNFQLRSVNLALDEVVVTGYSRQSKRDITGAASTVSAEVIGQTPVTDITTALQGRVAGVSVDDLGGPGNAATIRIRGVGTLGNNDPLYVIDGVQIRIGRATGSQDIANLINPGDIENITILKDPSLTALYGSEGSNGVIVITTKSGKKGEPKLEYNAYVANQTVTKFPSMITPQQQADAQFNAYANTGQAFPYASFYGSGGSPVLPDYIIQGPTANTGVAANDPAADPSLYNFSSYRILQSNKAGTDWWRTLFKRSVSQNHQLSLSGATDKSNYAITFNYLSDNGTFLNTYFKRLSLRANTDFKVKPWLRVGENLEVAYTTGNTFNNTNYFASFNNDISNLYGMPGLLPTHDIKGNISGLGGTPVLGGVSNPLINRTNAPNSKNSTEGIIGSAYIEAEPIKGLTYQSKIGFQLIPNQYHYLSDSVIQNPIPIRQTYFYEGSSYYTDWRWLNKIGYTTTIADNHKISAFIAYEAREFKSRYIGITVDSLISTQPNFQYINLGFLNPNFPPQGLGSKQTSTSEFGNVSYSYMDKYLASVTLRHDGSSIFGANHKYGLFPAASAGWRISQEKFMDDIKWLNDLKLRGSWGKAGNDAIPAGKQFSLIDPNNFIYGGYDLNATNLSQVVGAYLSQLGNPDVHWETNITTNLGFDATLFNNRLTASFNWFDRETKDLLLPAPYPGTAGAASAPYRNIMTFSNKGIELELGFRSANRSQLRYDMNFNIASYRSNVKYINEDSTSFLDGGIYAPTHYLLTRSVVGHPVSTFYGYVQEGIFQSNEEYTQNNVAHPGLDATKAAGHFKFKDLSGPDGKPDGKIDDKDRTYLGNPNPKFSYGFNLNLYYKNFDLGIFVQGVYGNKIFNYWRSFVRWPGALTSGSLDTWTPSNTKAPLPMYTVDGINGNNDNVPSSFFVENGSYLRFKTIQIGYNFPKTKAFGHLRVYIQAFNLFTITKYSGLDPEVNAGDPSALGIDFGTQYPMSKKLLLGVNLGL